jgi:hypothetical protein
MFRLPRIVPSLALACSLAVPSVYLATRAGADDATTAPAAGAAAAAAPDDAVKELQGNVESYLHYGLVARYDLAAAAGQKILDSQVDPKTTLDVFNKVARSRKTTTDSELARLNAVDSLKDVNSKILAKLNAGHIASSQDPAYIEKTIQAMIVNERAYLNGLQRLNNSGESAVPVMIDYLRQRDDQHRQYEPTIRRAFIDMGKVTLNPLLAATEMKDADTLVEVIQTLGALGYDTAAPYLARLANDPATSDAIKKQATEALHKLNRSSDNPADQFIKLANGLYSGNVNINQVVDKPGATPDVTTKVSMVWWWDAANHILTRQEVPAAIFNDVMTKRACEYALKIDGSKAEAVSLWLAANNKQEVDLPAGATDPTVDGLPNAHFYNVSAGVRYLNDALSRAVNDKNGPVALKLTHSLGQIIGTSSMETATGDPLIRAMSYPDKLVRYEAAFALAAGLPTKPFSHQEAVVPLLSEALGQGGKGNVVVFGASADDVNGLLDKVRHLGYNAAGDATAQGAANAASTLASVDAILISPDLPDTSVTQMMALAAKDNRLAPAAEVVMIKSPASQFKKLELSTSNLSTTSATDGDALKASIEAGRAKAGSAVLDDKSAADYSGRAVDLLYRLAVNHGSVLNVAVAEPGLLNALNDSRPEIATGAAKVLAWIPSTGAQQGLILKAVDASVTDPAFKATLFKSVATSAKLYGNKLDAAKVDQLQKAVEDLKDADVRAAAAEARGALNLPADEAKNLILKQSKVATGGTAPAAEAK